MKRALSCFPFAVVYTLLSIFSHQYAIGGCYADTNANCYIMLLFHYSARFLKKHKEPILQMFTQPPRTELLISYTENEPRHPVSWSQLQFRIIWINWNPTPSVHIHDPDERWDLVVLSMQISSMPTASASQGAKAEQMSLEKMSPKITITELPSVRHFGGDHKKRGCKKSEPRGAAHLSQWHNSAWDLDGSVTACS